MDGSRTHRGPLSGPPPVLKTGEPTGTQPPPCDASIPHPARSGKIRPAPPESVSDEGCKSREDLRPTLRFAPSLLQWPHLADMAAISNPLECPGGPRRSPEEYARACAFPANVERRIGDSLEAILPRGAQVVDLGAGTGRLSHLLLQRGFPVVAVDQSADMLGYCVEHLPRPQQRLQAIRADIACLPLPSGSCDAALAVHVLHLVREWHAALAEAGRILRPDGLLLIGWSQHAPDDPSRVIRRQWASLLERRGLAPRRECEYDAEVDAWIRQQGGRCQEFVAAEWERESPPADTLQDIRQKGVPTAILEDPPRLAALWEELEAWALDTYHDLGRPVKRSITFCWRVYQLPQPSSELPAGG